MDGLEDVAEAEIEEVLEQLRTKDRVEIRHSSRSAVMLRVCEQLKAPTTTAKSLILRSGASCSDLERLRDALRINETVEALKFVCLKTTSEIRAAITCCKQHPRLTSLSLMNYTPSTSRRTGEGREMVAAAVCDELFGTPINDQGEYLVHIGTNNYSAGGVPNICNLELDTYPLGSQGVQILEQAIASSTRLISLRLTSCDLRGDCTHSIAEIIRKNPFLQVLDLSHNRLFLGDGIRREMTLNVLVKRGLQYNTSLLELDLQPPAKLSKIERQLKLNRCLASYREANTNPFNIPPSVWAEAMAKVAPKPSILFEMLRDSAVALFR
jgi:hypothetical protein